jgi:hypothetical protein
MTPRIHDSECSLRPCVDSLIPGPLFFASVALRNAAGETHRDFTRVL